MNKIVTMMTMAGMAALLAGCNSPKEENFKYTIDAFADLKVMRYQIPGWEDLTLQQKEYAYHLAEASRACRTRRFSLQFWSQRMSRPHLAASARW